MPVPSTFSLVKLLAKTRLFGSTYGLKHVFSVIFRAFAELLNIVDLKHNCGTG